MRLANGLDEFYSRNFNDDEFEYFVDQYGNPTIDYPHVHIIFRNGDVKVIASQERGDHRWRARMSDPDDGNLLNRAIREAASHLNW